MNEVMHWNAILIEASRRDNTTGYANNQQPGPTATSRAMAIVHLAIHDAIAYLTNPAAAHMTKQGIPTPSVPAVVPAGVNIRDAVAGAAMKALKAMYPAYADYFDDALYEVQPAGFLFGEAVAADLLASRLNDGSATPATVPQPSSLPRYGHHRADPYSPGQPLLGKTWGQVTRFVGARVPLSNYPGRGLADLLTNAHYKKDYKEALGDGALVSSSRTAEQKLIGVYWGYDGADRIGVPPRLYNQIARRLVANHNKNPMKVPLTTAQTANLFAQLNVAMADGGIDAWFHKYDQDLWRPVVAAREEAPMHRDCFWAPLGAPQTNQVNAKPRTPPFPAYPSGHATFGAAVFQILRLVLTPAPALTVEDVLEAENDALPAIADEAFNFVSDELDGRAQDADGSLRTRVDRSFASFARAVWENSISRVYLGVHWRFDGLPRDPKDNIGGVPLGLTIGKHVHKAFSGTDSLA